MQEKQNRKYQARIAIRLLADDEKCFGPGVAELLERIREEGSLRKAASDMHMAYSKAWSILRDCERALGFPMLEKKAGGRNGGSSVLTENGEKMLEQYREFERRLRQESERLISLLEFPSDESGCEAQGKSEVQDNGGIRDKEAQDKKAVQDKMEIQDKEEIQDRGEV